jgi:hypothetical protein
VRWDARVVHKQMVINGRGAVHEGQERAAARRERRRPEAPTGAEEKRDAGA